MAVDKSSPAFPIPAHVNGWGKQAPQEYGLTMRDYFAGQVMNSVNLNLYTGSKTGDIRLEDFAALCYKLADAMLKERRHHG